jgi:predicted phage terminase large subunit-like protein
VDPAHRLIAKHLDSVIRGEIDRLMIFAPPQHGKSELVSIRLPAFWLAHRPEDPVILASYGASLAESHSSEARATVESEAYQALFPEMATRKDSRSKQLWRLQGRQGGLLAVGVGGPITGHGARLGIIDDPFENWRQAQSLTVRNHVWEWWRGTFRTRIWEGGAIILVMTRWHEDDLAGRLLSEQGDRWVVLRLPALAETQVERDTSNTLLGLPLGQPDPLGRAPGAALCPQRFSVEALLALKRDVGGLVWYAEYQGTPRAPEGNKFKRHWFRIVGEVPAAARRLRYWDKAGSDEAGDYTVGVLLAAHEGRWYIEDVVRGQWSDLEREKVIRQTAELDGRDVEIWVEQEAGSGGKDSAAATVRSLAGFTVHVDHPTGDKVVRASPFAAQCEAQNVFLKRGAWNGAYLSELCAFPNGAHDDQVDASSGAFNRLNFGKSGWAEYARRKRKELQQRS